MKKERNQKQEKNKTLKEKSQNRGIEGSKIRHETIFHLERNWISSSSLHPPSLSPSLSLPPSPSLFPLWNVSNFGNKNAHLNSSLLPPFLGIEIRNSWCYCSSYRNILPPDSLSLMTSLTLCFYFSERERERERFSSRSELSVVLMIIPSSRYNIKVK